MLGYFLLDYIYIRKLFVDSKSNKTYYMPHLFCTKYKFLLCYTLFLQSFKCTQHQPPTQSKYINRDGTPGRYTKLQEKNKDYHSSYFECCIEKLREEADAQRGIKWSLNGNQLVRDATHANGKMYAAADYAVQIMNIFRAAKKMCTLRTQDGGKFEELAIHFMKTYQRSRTNMQKTESFWIAEVKSINKNVIEELKKIFPTTNKKNLNKELRLTENYVGLDDKHYDITTKFKIKDQIFALEDKKFLKLTVTQQQAFKNRKSENWYLQLDKIEQQLIDAYINQFLDNRHYLPTQLRKLPGCRNAYHKRVLAYDKNGNETILGQYGHLGTLASLVEDSTLSEKITRDNWKQLCNFNEGGREILSLNHKQDVKFAGYIGEKQIVEQTHRIVGDNAFTCFPINLMGTFTTPIFKYKMGKLLDEASSMHNQNYTRGLSPQDFIFLKRLNHLKKATNSSDLSNSLTHNETTGNYYAELAANYATCKIDLDKRKKEKAQKPCLFITCKSGKDRTGYGSLLVDSKLIAPHLDLPDNATTIHNTIARTGHFQILASLNGGMPGRFGIKGGGIKKVNMHPQAHDALFRPTALSITIPL